jgi:carboxyl-terminal processing protease
MNQSTIYRLCVVLLFTTVFSISGKSQFFFNEQSFKLTKVIQLIENYYVDTINNKELVETAITKMLKELDPHSSYIPKKKVKAVNEPLQGSFEGIGIMFNILNDTVYVISPISGGPSEKVGIQAGDRIITVEGEKIAGIDITSKGVRDRLLGKKGTKVKVGIKRKRVDGLIYFTITRDKIPIHSLDAAYMIDDNIGYIKLNRFSKTTLDEFKNAVDSLQANNNFQHLVLDLTGNGGGYLEMAIRLADQFLDKSKRIVYTQGVNSPRQDFNATPFGDFEEGKVVIMIDEGSASASEIVSGAVQDWDRGVIVGRRSFGKGLVQRQFELQDSSMIRLTVAKYYTPTGRLIQKNYDKGYKQYRKEILDRYEHGELVNKDSIQFPDSLKYKTLLNKRTVYGGGGIMPDVFVPVDTNKVNDYYRDILSNSILYKFVLNYVDDNRKALLSQYTTVPYFIEHYTVNESILNELKEFASEEGVEADEEAFNEAQQDLSFYTKAYIARDLWDINAFYQIVNKRNDIFLKAKNILQDNAMYENVLQGKNTGQ